MALVANGDLEALGVLFDRYQERLYAFFVRYTGRRDVSEDLVQDVFLRILRYKNSFRDDAPFTVWMYQLARNAASDRFSKWRREHPLSEGDHERMQSEDRVHDLVAEREEQTILHEALGRLSPDKREVLLLSRFEDLTYEEISSIIHAPVGTIKARVHYALKDLRREFRALTEPPARSTGKERPVEGRTGHPL